MPALLHDGAATIRHDRPRAGRRLGAARHEPPSRRARGTPALLRWSQPTSLLSTGRWTAADTSAAENILKTPQRRSPSQSPPSYRPDCHSMLGPSYLVMPPPPHSFSPSPARRASRRRGESIHESGAQHRACRPSRSTVQISGRHQIILIAIFDRADGLHHTHGVIGE